MEGIGTIDASLVASPRCVQCLMGVSLDVDSLPIGFVGPTEFRLVPVSSHALMRPFLSTIAITFVLSCCRAAESMQKVTATGWKQAQQGIKGLTGGPLQVSSFLPLQLCRRVPGVPSSCSWSHAGCNPAAEVTEDIKFLSQNPK